MADRHRADITGGRRAVAVARGVALQAQQAK